MDRLDDNQLKIVLASSLMGGNQSKAEQAEAILKARQEKERQGGSK